MDYRVMLDIDGMVIDRENVARDVEVVVDGEIFSHEAMSFKSSEKDLAAFARKSFVNFIQASDAQVARLIIRHASALGVKNIVAIHDCFRVSVADVSKLEQAIVMAYDSLFGSEQSNDMVDNADMMALYFEGANKSLKEGIPHASKFVQFDFSKYAGKGVRRFKMVNGVSINAIIADWNGSAYFGK